MLTLGSLCRTLASSVMERWFCEVSRQPESSESTQYTVKTCISKEIEHLELSKWRQSPSKTSSLNGHFRHSKPC